MDEIFHRALDIVTRERRLRVGPERIPTDSYGRVEVLRGSPENAQDLAILNSAWDPSRLPENTRFRFAKRLVLRLLKPFSLGQVWFNAAVCRIVSSREDWLRRLPADMNEAANGLLERVRILEADVADLRREARARSSRRDPGRAAAEPDLASPRDRLAVAEARLSDLQRIVSDLRQELGGAPPA